MVVPIELGESFVSATPEVLFQGDYLVPTLDTHYDVTSDGARFLMIKDTAGGTDARPRVNVVLNWTQELLERVPVN